MRFIRLFLAVLLIAGAPMVGMCAEEPVLSAATNEVTHAAGAEAQAGHETEKHELSAAPVDLIHIGPIPITNSMVLTWGAAAALIIFARMATKNIKEIPSGAQNFWEWLVEGLYDFLDGIIGRDLAKKTFWFFASVFIFILAANWFGLIPGVGTVVEEKSNLPSSSNVTAQ
jgi:F-type H+-transporting ATPase subunit a